METLTKTTGIILSGGSSRRMGQDKGRILLYGRPLIAHVCRTLESVCSQIMIVAQTHQDFSFLGHPVVHDNIPGYGSLMGLYTGLRWAETDRILVLACDMPFVRPQVLRLLTTVAPQADVVVPRINGYLEPLLAVYSKACLKPIESMIKRSEKCVYDFFPDVRVREVHQKEIEVLDPGLHSFVNINTPQDLETVTGSNDFFRSEFAGNG